MATTVGDDRFDMPFRWRWDAVRALGLEADERMAGLSPGPAYPSILRSIAATVPRPVDLVVDLGAGAGGGSAWLRRALDATVIAVDPLDGACATARAAFPELQVVRAPAESTGLASGCADLVTICGVLSLLDGDATPLGEASRLLKPEGHLAVADLFPTELTRITSGSSRFDSVESLRDALAAAGFEIVELGFGAASLAPAWAGAADAVDRWIRRNRSMERRSRRGSSTASTSAGT